MKRYNPKDIEPRWQKAWEEQAIYRATEDSKKPKQYILEYFPYPSGAAMHVGHVRNYTIGDVLSRYARMRGHNVLHPMGWDAFGLPAENYAIDTGINPQQAVKENVAKFKKQLIQMGFSYDWSREINSTDPAYYKWTQWFFLLLFKRGLAYQQDSLQWWCPVDKTVLANEQVENGLCWRCGNKVEKKALKQWFFKITDYADRLEKDLDDVNWSESIKTQQRNWIGRSRGAEITFSIAGSNKTFSVFTTRHDTQFGMTFVAVAPEHRLVESITTSMQRSIVEAYVKQAVSKSDIERQQEDRAKTGVFSGRYAINPVNNEKIPIWIADYVLLGYGTGIVMGVPGHDLRDKEFAEKYHLEIRKVYQTTDGPDYHTEGVVINSGIYNGQRTEVMREKILADMIKAGYAKEVVNYKLRDWLISRQRYWGAPIPIIHCPEHGAVPVLEKDLPVVLPEMKGYEPSGEGRSPLARVPEFVNTTCPICSQPAQRETDTMDGFACSSWYFLRFADPHNDQAAFDKAKAEYWLPVDDYIGGAEHAVMHLLYARFWTKVMFDAGLISFEEPFRTLRNHGMILAPNGQKMSKSKNNTIEPDGLIDQGYGADAIRTLELFIGPWNQMANWSVEGLGGAFRFLQRSWSIVQEYLGPKTTGQTNQPAVMAAAHQAIAKVSQDLEELGFNTAIASLMEYVNTLLKLKAGAGFADRLAWQFAVTSLVQLLAPFAPHIAEELWQQLGHKDSVHTSSWPVHDPQYLLSDSIIIVVQVNGKVRATMSLASEADEAAVTQAAQAEPNVIKYIDKPVKKTVYVPGKLINFVV